MSRNNFSTGGGDDLIILVLGPSGSGKSHFIKSITGQNVDISTGPNLKPCTKRVQAYRCRHWDNTRDVVLFDTPGHDEKDIFSEIHDWLKAERMKEVKFSGILHLFRLASIVNSNVRNPCQKFERRCDIKVFPKTVLATTTSDSDGSDEEMLQDETKLNNEYWEWSLKNGAKSCRVDPHSPWEVINKFTSDNSGTVVMKVTEDKVMFEPPKKVQEEPSAGCC